MENIPDKITSADFNRLFKKKAINAIQGSSKSGMNTILHTSVLADKLASTELYIGIDPGTDTGYAIWNVKTKSFHTIKTWKIHQVILDIVQMYKNGHSIKVIIEDARLRKWYGEKSNAKLQGAGSIKRDCTIWEQFLTDWGIPFELVHPQEGMTKWTSELFNQSTGFKGSTSSHGRDAALLVYNKK